MVYLGGALGVNTYLMYGFFNTSRSRSTRPPRSTAPATRASSSRSSCGWSTPILAVVGLLSFIGIVQRVRDRQRRAHDPRSRPSPSACILVANQRYADWSVFAAGAVIAALPVMALFLFLQKYIVGGLTQGSVKG